MKPTISKKTNGSILRNCIPNSFNIKSVLVAVSSVLLLSYLSDFSGSDLSTSKASMIQFLPSDTQAKNVQSFPIINDPHHGHVKLMVRSGNQTYTTDVYFNENATLGLDPGYDALMFNGFTPDFSLYSFLVEDTTDGLPFTIQALSETAIDNVVISLGMNASQGQEISFSIAETDLPESINVYLEDEESNSFTLLNNNNYQTIADNNISGAGRFYLRFEGNALSVSESLINRLDIFTDHSDKTIVINGQLPYATNLKLYDINGKLLIYKVLDVNSIKQTIDIANLVSGICILELTNAGSRKRVEKLILR
ncbi:T9SS type A sorting domain-containing protein [Winogradskyella sp.]|uniref:T9SS type A sorting domain-containing protein n=1 Tax=Winogradskyella sp. TaxID=1883156 RepID=UPI002638BF13|nr:T9SS type A sorting domain-containing protein [Winogradskyella sp.]